MESLQSWQLAEACSSSWLESLQCLGLADVVALSVQLVNALDRFGQSSCKASGSTERRAPVKLQVLDKQQLTCVHLL